MIICLKLAKTCTNDHIWCLTDLACAARMHQAIKTFFIVFYSFFFFLLLSLFFEVYNPDFIKQVSGTKVRFKLLNDLKIYNREL